MKDSKRKVILWSTVVFLTLSSYAIYDYFSKQSTTLRSTEKPLCDLVPPFKKVLASRYMDGGSIGIYAEDHEGQIAELFIPYNYNIHGYEYVYRGSANDGKWLANPLTDSETAIEDIKTILRSTPNEYTDKCLRSIEFKTGASRSFFHGINTVYEFFR